MSSVTNAQRVEPSSEGLGLRELAETIWDEAATLTRTILDVATILVVLLAVGAPFLWLVYKLARSIPGPFMVFLLAIAALAIPLVVKAVILRLTVGHYNERIAIRECELAKASYHDDPGLLADIKGPLAYVPGLTFGRALVIAFSTDLVGTVVGFSICGYQREYFGLLQVIIVTLVSPMIMAICLNVLLPCAWRQAIKVTLYYYLITIGVAVLLVVGTVLLVAVVMALKSLA
jgi:hypothetical protein